MLRFETTHEYYIGNSPSLYYCEEHECLMLTPDHEDTIRISGIDNETMLKFARKLVQEDLDKTLAKYEDKETTKEETANVE